MMKFKLPKLAYIKRVFVFQKFSTTFLKKDIDKQVNLFYTIKALNVRL